MKRHISCLLLWCFTVVPVCAQIFLPVRIDGKWGLIDSAGRIQISPQYDNIEDVPSWPLVKIAYLDGRSMLIDINNKPLTSYMDDEIVPLGDSAVLTIIDGKKGALGLDGKEILPNRFNKIIYLQDGYFLATNSDKKLELFNKRGEGLPGGSYDSLSVTGQFILAYATDTTFIFNTGFRLIHSGKYRNVKLTYPFIALYPDKREQFIILNSSGEQITEGYFSSWENAGSRYIIASGHQNLLLFRKSQLTLLVEKYEKYQLVICDTLDYLELKYTNGKRKVFDEYMNVFEMPENSGLLFCSRGFFVMEKDGLKGLLDRKGRVILPARFEDLYPLESKFIRVLAGKRSGLYTFEGKEILPCKYDDIEIAGSMIKAYLPQKEVVLLLDENLNVIESQVLKDVTSLSVREADTDFDPAFGQPGMQNRNWTSSADLGNWRFDPLKNLWGYWSNDSFLLKPSFKSIQRFTNYGVTLVTSEGNKNGLVQDNNGLVLHKCGYDRLFTNDLDASRGAVLRAFNKRGMYLVRTNGRTYRRVFTYIGDFHEGMARFNYRGYFSCRDFKRPYRYDLDISAINLNGYALNERGFRYDPAKVLLQRGKWGFFNSAGDIVIDTVYDWVSDFSSNVSFVKRNDKWGFLTLGLTVVRPRYDEIGFLPGSNQSKILSCNYINKFCYVDRHGNSITKPIYDKAYPFKGGFARVSNNGFYYFINAEGREINSEGFGDARDFDNGFAAVQIGGLWGVIDTSGELVVQPAYKRIGRISENRVEVQYGSWGYASTVGEKDLPRGFQRVMWFSGDRAWVMHKGKWGMIDKDGKYIVKPRRYKTIKYSAQMGVFYASKRKHWEMLDAEGKKLFRKTFRKYTDFREGVAILSNGKKHYLKSIESPKYYKVRAGSISPFSCGRAVIRTGSRYGAVNYRGRVVIPMRYQKLDSFSGCLAAYRWGGSSRNFGYIDTTGMKVIRAAYSFAGPFKDGWARVKRNEEFFYLNRHGREINTSTYNAIVDFRDSIGAIRFEGRVALVNPGGKLITPYRFSEINGISEGIALMQVDKVYGLANNEGKVYFEPSFESVKPVSDQIYRIERGSEVGYYHVTKGWIWELTK